MLNYVGNLKCSFKRKLIKTTAMKILGIPLLAFWPYFALVIGMVLMHIFPSNLNVGISDHKAKILFPNETEPITATGFLNHYEPGEKVMVYIVTDSICSDYWQSEQSGMIQRDTTIFENDPIRGKLKIEYRVATILSLEKNN